MIKESWRSAIPNFDDFSNLFSEINTLSSLSFLDLQPRLAATFERFSQLNTSRFLLINSPDNSVYRKQIQQSFQEVLTDHKSYPVTLTETLDPNDLFGRYQVTDGKVTILQPGLLEQAHNGYLIIPANLILANPVIWSKLKAVALGLPSTPVNQSQEQIAQLIPSAEYNIKLIIVGDRVQLGDFEMFDSDVRSSLCLFGEIELDIKTDSEASLKTYLQYVNGICETAKIPTIQTIQAWKEFLIQGARYAEDQHRMPLCLIWHIALLSEAFLESDNNQITAESIIAAVQHKEFRESYLPSRALDDILDGQVVIETQGERIGQVNGLTVIEVPGHPVTYGEPARISCVIHFGDGDISDVERKAELGGNLHAKGMMIMQAFLTSALNLDEPLPFAASIVFEQSYSEVDGDSASLAELCSLLSALSECPINQSIAVTGAVDQFGRVQAVGGLNEKIEGFFHVCQHQGLTGQQGVIIPRSNLKHLSLHRDVLEALKQDQFHLWSIESVDEALPLLLNKAFRETDDNVLQKIAERIENLDKHHEEPTSFFYRLRSLLSKY